MGICKKNILDCILSTIANANKIEHKRLSITQTLGKKLRKLGNQKSFELQVSKKVIGTGIYENILDNMGGISWPKTL